MGEKVFEHVNFSTDIDNIDLIVRDQSTRQKIHVMFDAEDIWKLGKTGLLPIVEDKEIEEDD